MLSILQHLSDRNDILVINLQAPSRSTDDDPASS